MDGNGNYSEEFGWQHPGGGGRWIPLDGEGCCWFAWILGKYNQFRVFLPGDRYMTVDFNFKGDQVEITNWGGGATKVYDIIGENKYQ